MIGRKYHLSDSLAQLISDFTFEQKEYIAEMMDFYIDQYQEKLKEHDPISVAASFHHHLDQHIQEGLSKEDPNEITCKKGCSHCCNLHVDVTMEEAILLYEFAKENYIEIDWEKAKRQSKYNVENWLKQPKEDCSCLFLDEKSGTCKVYQYRPMNCRKLFSLDDVEKCYPFQGIILLKRFVYYKAEALASAVATATHVQTLSTLLLAVHHGKTSNSNNTQP